jgi:hypothetical protein
MHTFRSAVLSGVLAVVTASAHAGAGTAQVTMKALSTQVTYSSNAVGRTPALQTFIGYDLLLKNAGTNTINAVQFTVSISAKDPTETITLLSVTQSNGQPSGCTLLPPSQFKCVVGQLKSDATFPGSGQPLLVFYNAPVKGAGILEPDTVDAVVTVQYAEGGNGPNSVPQNSTVEAHADTVMLGTNNPIDVKTAVPPAGATLLSGTGGIPTSDTRLTEVVAVPSYASGKSDSAAVTIDKVLDSTDLQCGNLGHFIQCPIYKTTVVQEVNLQVIESEFLQSPWLATTYRIDASNLKMSASQILSSTELRYTGGTFSNALVPVCVNKAPNGGINAGLPCILSSQCYKRSTPGWTPELDGDCEWTLINTRNGSLKIQ